MLLLLINIKKARFLYKICSKTAFYGLDTDPEPEPELDGTGNVINSYGSATLIYISLVLGCETNCVQPAKLPVPNKESTTSWLAAIFFANMLQYVLFCLKLSTF
jgi:hypothetical protein